jgi:hypothetical protein
MEVCYVSLITLIVVSIWCFSLMFFGYEVPPLLPLLLFIFFFGMFYLMFLFCEKNRVRESIKNTILLEDVLFHDNRRDIGAVKKHKKKLQNMLKKCNLHEELEECIEQGLPHKKCIEIGQKLRKQRKHLMTCL